MLGQVRPNASIRSQQSLRSNIRIWFNPGEASKRLKFLKLKREPWTTPIGELAGKAIPDE